MDAESQQSRSLLTHHHGYNFMDITIPVRYCSSPDCDFRGNRSQTPSAFCSRVGCGAELLPAEAPRYLVAALKSHAKREKMNEMAARLFIRSNVQRILVIQSIRNGTP